MTTLKPMYELTPRAVLGEGPIYRFSDHTLHFNDCGSNKIHIVAIDPETGDVDHSQTPRTVETEDSVSVHCFREHNENSFICLYYQGIGYLDEKTGKITVLKEIIPSEDRDRKRMNDGAVDPKGRFWGGEVDKLAAARGLGHCLDEEPLGHLWRFDPDGSLHKMATGLVCSNGIGWSPDLTTMYLNDSMGQKVSAFDYDLESGSIKNRRTIKDFQGTKEEPDGLVIDVDGNIWTALWGGHRVICISPVDGSVLEEVYVSAKRPTCPTWGGKDNDTLYVTSASGENEPGDSKDDSGAGHLFKIKTHTHGMPKYTFAG